MRVACLVTMVVLALCVCVQADDAAQMKRARAEAARRVGGLAINNDAVDTQNRTPEQFIARTVAIFEWPGDVAISRRSVSSC